MGRDGNIGLDAARRPVRVPPAFAHYLEKHEVFTMFETLMKQLLIERPADPLDWMIQFLQRPAVPKVFVYGPPGAGKRTVCDELATMCDAVVVDVDGAVKAAIAEGNQIGKAAEAHNIAGTPVPNELQIDALLHRLAQKDCQTKGYIVAGFPKTRMQAVALQVHGVMPTQFILLECSDEVVLQRTNGRRYDEAGGVHHSLFKPPPPNVTVTKAAKDETPAVLAELEEFHRTLQDVKASYKAVLKTVDADQPVEDVVSTIWTTICTKPYANAPTIPRLLLLGPPGAGKSTQAELLALKYDLVHVSLDELIKQAHSGLRSKAAAAIRDAKSNEVQPPDLVLLELVTDRLAGLDCQTQGWALEGFPSTQMQAEMLEARGFAASRVLFLDVPDDTVWDRLTTRRIDPVTGQRYHVGGQLSQYYPPDTTEELERLKAHPDDAPYTVEARLAASKEHVVALKAYYKGAATEVNADQEAHTVFQFIDSRLVMPLLEEPAVL